MYKVRVKSIPGTTAYNFSYGKGQKKLLNTANKLTNGKFVIDIGGSETSGKLRELKEQWGAWAGATYNGSNTDEVTTPDGSSDSSLKLCEPSLASAHALAPIDLGKLEAKLILAAISYVRSSIPDMTRKCEQLKAAVAAYEAAHAASTPTETHEHVAQRIRPNGPPPHKKAGDKSGAIQVPAIPRHHPNAGTGSRPAVEAGAPDTTGEDGSAEAGTEDDSPAEHGTPA